MATKVPRAKSKLEATLALQIKAEKLPTPGTNVQLVPGRRWAYDFVWLPQKIIVEVEGGTRPFYQWQNGKKVLVNQGRHTTAKGFEDDCEKYNAMEVLGWMLLRYTSAMVKSGKAIEQIKRVLQ